MTRGVDWIAALDELGLVHRKEQAALLRDAASLVCATSRRGRPFVAGAARARWRQACLEAITVAEADRVDVEPLLRNLAADPVARWPAASRLARASLALDRCVAGSVALARAWICENETRAAIELLCELAAGPPHAPDRCDVLEALALALESAGALDESLDAYASALRIPGCAPRVAVSMFALALRRGDAAWIDFASARLLDLDLSIPGVRTRFQVALARAVERAVVSI